jgi:hypothetical protein
LLDKGLLDKGLSYNPAVQPKDFFKESKNRRIYDEGDVLYNTMGQFVPDNEVRPSVAEINPLLQPIPGAMAYNAWLAHRLSNFTGGTLKKKKNKY